MRATEQQPDNPPGGPGYAARVHATVWGLDGPHEDTAVIDLIDREWPCADTFDVRAMYKLDPGMPCPLDLQHPSVLASHSGLGWAWVLHGVAEPASRT